MPHFGVYLLLGIVLWNFFVEVTQGSVAAIVMKGDLMRKVNFPRYVIILAGAFSALINLVFNLSVVSVFMWLGKAEPNVHILLFPLLALELFVFSLSVAFILSAMFVRFRDISYIWEILLQVAFYATPILYAFSFVSSKSVLLSKLVMVNPLAQIIQDARYGLVTDKTTTIAGAFHYNASYAYPLVIVFITAVSSVIYFKRKSPYFAEDV